MLRRLGVRGKILATLAVPVLVLLVAAAFISWGALQDAQRAEQTSSLVDSLELQDRAGTAVANERGLTVGALGELPDVAEQLPAAQEITDAAVDERDAALELLELDTLGPHVGQAVNLTLDDRRELDDIQRRVLSGQVPAVMAGERYIEIIDRALDVPVTLSLSSADPEMVALLNAYVAMDQVMLANTYERPLVAIALMQYSQEGEIDTDLVGRMTTSIREADEQRTEALDAVAALSAYGIDLDLPELSTDLDQVRFQMRYLNPSRVEPDVAAQWADLSQEWVEQMQPVRDEIRAATIEHAQSSASAANARALLTVVGTFGIVVLSLVLALVIARRIVQPLRRLTVATGEVRDRLPRMVEQMAVPGQEPAVDLIRVPVESTDEIGRLADAFNQVNETTMDVAREQAALRGSIAEMFVNVARRDQVLLNRQLTFLDELERSEEDATTLSNLFRLDHLATRMRRNAESLLVLAGIDSGRRVRHPMPVSDVIRTASSEIELYDRVRLNLNVDPHMLGHNALNAAHLLAELLENATMFSEPHTPVEVSTGRDERGVVVVVRDYGLGMSAAEIAEATSKVSSTAASDAVGAQRLGLYVVGRLAARLGAKVDFAAGSDAKGTVVTVVFPAELFVPDDSMPLPQPTDPLEASTQQAAAQVSGVIDPVPATVPATSQIQAVGSGAEQSPAEPVAPYAPQAPVAPYAQPAPVAPYAQPARAASAASAPSRSPMRSEPEPPAAVPVDLEALTDGTTSTGMPRRRRGDEGPPTEAVVLPEISAPSVEPEMQAEEPRWSPPSGVADGKSLPSRRRGAASAQELGTESGALPLLSAQPEPAAPMPVEQRTGLFSSFRSMDAMESSSGTEALQLDPVTESPTSVPDVLSSPAEAPRGHHEQVAPAPQVAEAPLLPTVTPPVVETSPVFDEVAAATASQPTVGGPRDVSREADQGFQTLPAFDELMTDLPTKRSETPAERKRGLFGRKPAADVAAAAAASVTGGTPVQDSQATAAGTGSPSAFHRVAEPEPQPSFGREEPPAPRPAPQAAPVAHAHQGEPPAQPEPWLSRPPAGPVASAPDARFAPPAAPAAPPVPAQAPAPVQPPAPQRYEAPGAPGGSAPVTVRPAPVEEIPYQPTSLASSGSAASAAGPVEAVPAPSEARSESGYGGSVLPLRATTSDRKDPLDPHFVPDTVEARSEWMASAVLYEEMSTLMQRGVFQEESVTTTNEDQTYRPTTVAATVEPIDGSLTRRSRSAAPVAPVERFSARIERDPEKLRARLSAFQTATARGRSAVGGPEGSTDAPLTVNDVPGSSPQQR